MGGLLKIDIFIDSKLCNGTNDSRKIINIPNYIVMTRRAVLICANQR